MKMKAIALCLAVVQLLLLSGCWNYVEIDDQLNVSGMALDIGEQGCRCHLSAEVVTVGKSENAGFEAHVIESNGGTVFEAIRNLMTLTSKKLYFGHCRILIIGEPLAQYGICELLDLPIRNHEMRANMDVIIAKGTTGEKVLKTQGITTNIISYKISDILKTSERAVGRAAASKDYQVYDGVRTPGLSITIPAFELYRMENKDIIELCGAGVFCSDRLIGYLNEEQLKDLSIMKGKLRTGLLTSEAAGSPYYTTSFEVHKAAAKTKISCTADGITASYNVELWVNVGETQTHENFLDKAALDTTRRALELSLREDMTNLVKAAQQTYRCDFFGVGEQIEQQDPDCWKKLQKNWDTAFPKVRFNVVCKVNIIGSGVSNSALE